MSQPRGGYGKRQPGICYQCNRRRSTYRFNCASRTIVRVTGVHDSPRNPVRLCQQCATDVFGADAIESEIAAGRLLWKSQRQHTPDSTQLSLPEEQ